MNYGDRTAFPQPVERTTWKGVPNVGLTKREYFAGLALQALASEYRIHDQGGAARVAENAVMYADALLAELAKGGAE